MHTEETKSAELQACKCAKAASGARAIKQLPFPVLTLTIRSHAVCFSTKPKQNPVLLAEETNELFSHRASSIASCCVEKNAFGGVASHSDDLVA